jgi:hypothetical protein
MLARQAQQSVAYPQFPQVHAQGQNSEKAPEPANLSVT